MEESPFVQQDVVMSADHQLHSDFPAPAGCYKYRRLFLVLLSCSLFATALGLGIYSHLQKTGDPWTSQWKLAAPPCLSPACLRASEHFSVPMDPFSHPCDYFLFACGTSGSNPENDSQRFNGVFSEDDKRRGARTGGLRRVSKETDVQRKRDGLQYRFPDRQTAFLMAIREILEAGEEDCIGAAEQKAKQFFKSCMNTESPERVGAEPFLKLLQQLGGWAVSGVWNQTDFNHTLALLMSQYSTFPFFNVYIDEPHFQFPIDWNNKTHKSKASTKFLRPFFLTCGQYLALLGVSPGETTQHCGLYVSLSTTLAVATSPLHYRLGQKLLYHKITIQELQIVAPAIDWLSSLQATFAPLPISQSDVVLVHNLPYIIQMSQTISQWQVQHEAMGTGPLHTYMMLSLLQTLIPALDSRFFQTTRNYSILTGDTEEEKPRWRRCIQETERGFDDVLSRAIREKHAQEEAEGLIQDVYSSLKKKILDLHWRDEKTASFILKKIQSLNPTLTIKPSHPSDVELNQFYQEVEVSEGDFFSSYLQMLRLEQKSRGRRLSHASLTQGLSITPSILNDNILISAGIFVSPFFHSSYPRALNYGALGSLLAKDLLHLLFPDIYTQASDPASESKCVWDHYLSVTKGLGQVDMPFLPPSNQQEVWVQYSALQVALDAYKRSFTKNRADSSLFGLSYIHLFLSSFTQVTCAADTLRGLMPFQPSFLVTVLCSNLGFCPETFTCSSQSQSFLGESCLR
ncbi:hypothetical protein DNTS_030383 [Danionella cerebrum]|uniref:Peptidase M13 N-terminal domain-containing protein n=1 Tax=Danionella cerebrum TaxID=2873325 RepID=A0A553QWE9_9TELE|nr:hypothetical protein DNTS_030383 [Danionella translucida]